MSSFSSKNSIDKCFFSEWISNVTNKIDERITNLANQLQTYKHIDCLSSKDFVVAPIHKATRNIALFCERFYASLFVKVFDLHKNSSAGTYSKINKLSANDVICKLNLVLRIFLLKIFDWKSYWKSWMSKIYTKPIKARCIIASIKCYIKPLARIVTSIFRVFFREIEVFNSKYKFFTGLYTLGNIEQ